MPERRIANIMGKAGRLHNFPNVIGFDKGRQIPLFCQKIPVLRTKGTSHRGNFQRMGKTRMHMIIGRKGVNLCFSGQTPKRIRKNNPVMVGNKGAPSLVYFLHPLFAIAFRQ
jgi:hypothetical protein